VGVFYPPHAKQEDYLPFYAAVFDTVEIDTTFYHPPKPTIVRSWARHTPETFRFTAKLPHQITHEARLSRMGERLSEFVRALEPLGDRRGPLLVQLPADFVRDSGTVGVLERFLAAAPSETRLAIEFRDRSWHLPQTWELLRAHRATLAWTEWRDLPRVTEVTGDFLYARWLGDRRTIERYDRVQVARAAEFELWDRELRRALPEVREVYGYFNNHWAGHSPASANEMKRRLGLEVVEPKEQWPQRELW
jgi:uncharacterized protein YecE (DUF72 family)